MVLGGMMNRRQMSDFMKDPLKVKATLDKLFENDLHSKRVLSLANSVVGVLDAAARFRAAIQVEAAESRIQRHCQTIPRPR